MNVVQEMAIAAGIPAPEVRLLDAQVANAAAVGTDVTASYVVVGRRLLDEFDREETEGLLAHLIGSIGNGDLRGAAQIHSLLYVLELLIVVVLAPFARYPRRIAWRWLTFPLLGAFGSREARAERARALMELLMEHRKRFGAGGGDDPSRARPRLLRPAGRDPRAHLPAPPGPPRARDGGDGLPAPLREPAGGPPLAEPPVSRGRDGGRAHPESDRTLPGSRASGGGGGGDPGR